MSLPGATAFLSAFLLFTLEPLTGRALLPGFGGGPPVWTGCLVLFQVGLLLGYAWAHAIARLPAGVRLGAHALLLGAALTRLPLDPALLGAAAGDGHPLARLSVRVALGIGLPFVALAATTPVVHAFVHGGARERGGYRLFAASNAGALIALAGYPLVIEPSFGLARQARLWSATMVVASLLVVVVGRIHLRGSAPAAAAAGTATARTSRLDRLYWLALPAVASWLLLAISEHLTRRVSPAPFIWIVPLAAYLLTFIVAFAGDRWYGRGPYQVATVGALGLALYLLTAAELARLAVHLAGWAAILFVVGMTAHGELARRRPAGEERTAYYLAIAAGGALGGLVVAVLAPLLLTRRLELEIGLVVAIATAGSAALADASPPRRRRLLAGVVVVVLFTAALVRDMWHGDTEVIARSRSYHGVLEVADTHPGEPDRGLRRLRHDGILHGVQRLAPAERHLPTAYFAPTSGVGLLLQSTPRPMQAGVVGLGVGTLAAYLAPGDRMRFYEIDPDVTWYARLWFTYLDGARGEVDVRHGDARIRLAAEAPQSYGVLVLDAFSGDAVPVHLLTREAFALYDRHIAAGGAIAVHVTNLHLDLGPLVRGQLTDLGYDTLTLIEDATVVPGSYLNVWVLGARDPRRLDPLRPIAAADERRFPPDRLWSDDRADVLSVVLW